MGVIFDVGWLEQYISALVLMNVLLGQPRATIPISEPTPDSVVRLLNAIASGTYKPSEHFLESARERSLLLRKKEINPNDTYILILLNATTPQSDLASVNIGGVLFEDPSWAVFAAVNVAHKEMFALPLADNDDALWGKIPELEKSIRQSTYSPIRFFAPITGFTSQGIPHFSLLQVSGKDLGELRRLGTNNFGAPRSHLYQLYLRPRHLSQ